MVTPRKQADCFRSDAFGWPNRRQVLASLAASLVASASGGAAHARVISTPLIVPLNLALIETVIALGVERFAAPGLSSFQSPAGLPQPPAAAFDIGAAVEPNMELLIQERPAMFLYSPGFLPDPSVLRRLAPVANVPIYMQGGDPYIDAGKALDQIASLIDRPQAAINYRRHVIQALDEVREIVAPYRDQRFLLVNSQRPQSMTASGHGSLFGGVLADLGLRNAVTERGSVYGYVVIEARQLLTMDDVWAVHLGPLPRRYATNPFWQALPFVKAKRIVEIPRLVQWGGLPTALAFATAMGQAIRSIEHGAHG